MGLMGTDWEWAKLSGAPTPRKKADHQQVVGLSSVTGHSPQKHGPSPPSGLHPVLAPSSDQLWETPSTRCSLPLPLDCRAASKDTSIRRVSGILMFLSFLDCLLRYPFSLLPSHPDTPSHPSRATTTTPPVLFRPSSLVSPLLRLPPVSVRHPTASTQGLSSVCLLFSS
jgi:hypothetical protein